MCQIYILLCRLLVNLTPCCANVPGQAGLDGGGGLTFISHSIEFGFSPVGNEGMAKFFFFFLKQSNDMMTFLFQKEHSGTGMEEA